MAGESQRSLVDEPPQCGADGSPGPSFGRDGASLTLLKSQFVADVLSPVVQLKKYLQYISWEWLLLGCDLI